VNLLVWTDSLRAAFPDILESRSARGGTLLVCTISHARINGFSPGMSNFLTYGVSGNVNR